MCERTLVSSFRRRIRGLCFTLVAIACSTMLLLSCAPVGAMQKSAYYTAGKTLAGLSVREVVVDGVTFSIAEGGSGSPLLLLHGFSASKETWYGFARHLVGAHRVIIPDLAPFGAGTSEGLSNTVSAQVKRVDALLEALDVTRAHVVGNSMGGYIGALLAVRHPERVATLTLIDSAGVDMPRPSAGARRLEKGENLFMIDDAEDADAFFDMIFVKKPPITPSIRADFVATERARRVELQRWFEELRGDYVPLEPLLGDVRAPTLVVWGREDQVLDVSMAEVFANGVPDVRVHILPNVGHCPQMEEPSLVAGLVRDFAAAQGAASAPAGAP
jgi:abhydrolase domain-containing protein 6